MADYLTHNGITAAYYHAGLEPRERDVAQGRWMRGEVKVMVATNAFGMGIDKRDVRFVIHLDIPSSIEAYFQEAGRAGRDGQKSFAVLLYNEKDLETLQQNFETSFPTRQKIANTYRAICNYYQLPIGSGENCQFDFDLEGLCNTYNLKVLELFSATRFLEREGLLTLPDREESESRVFVPISREELYKFQVEQPKYSDLLLLMLRMYGGLFTDFVPISERTIARRMYMDVEQVTNMLLHMDALKVIVYQGKHKRPQIIEQNKQYCHQRDLHPVYAGSDSEYDSDAQYKDDHNQMDQ
jgi:ATP-dependent DNA helicase RecQ